LLGNSERGQCEWSMVSMSQLDAAPHAERQGLRGRAATEIDKWDMTDGKPMAGLLRRRQAEAALSQKA
jgi:hypothetical protein